MRPRRWRQDGNRRERAAYRGRPERTGPPPRRPAFGSGRPGEEHGEIVARLERLESLIAAIAAHLGIEARGSRRDRAARGGPRAGSASSAGTPDDHAVVKTVARRLSGRLKLYHPDRGFGFVVSQDTPGDVFFHRSDCRIDPASLDPSAPVTFDLVEMANGQSKAVNLAPGRASPGPAEEAEE